MKLLYIETTMSLLHKAKAFVYLCCCGGCLKKPLLLPQTACNNASNFHWLFQVLAL